MSEEGWIGVDWDGTFVHYDGWKGIGVYGEPIELMRRRVLDWLAAGKEVKIMTARVGGPDEADNEAERLAIQDYCRKHLGQALEVTCKKDFLMEELYDDRAVTVEKNTGKIITIGHEGSESDYLGSFLE